MSPITTHILDTSLGRPAAGVGVTLSLLAESGDPKVVGRSVTNEDGRAADLLAEGAATAGVYRLSFDTTAYFAASGRESFYPQVEITFRVNDPSEHYHVPLLLSPHGYTTYRGS